MSEQALPMLLSALLGEGVSPEQIERAVERVLDHPPGRLIASMAAPLDRAMVAAFVREQERRLDAE